MHRRAFIAGTGSAVAAGVAGRARAAAEAPAVHPVRPAIRWRLASSFPASLDTVHGAAKVMSRTLEAITDGRFRIEVFASGELVPPLQVFDAVAGDTVECGHTSALYAWGKDPTFAIASTLPFGLNARQQTAWLLHGGGTELFDEFFARYGVVGVPGGNTGVQMGGWFRKEIRTLGDVQGLKMRIAGIAGRVVERIGIVPLQIPGSDIFPALESGAIDAVEWVGPHDDEKLGFFQIAKYYYYPAFWEGGATIHFFINKDRHDALPPAYRAALRAACAVADQDMLAKYDGANAAAIKRLVARGITLKPLPKDILDAARQAAFALYDELSAENAAWRTIYGPWSRFRHDIELWFRVAEFSFDSYVYAAQAAGR